MAYKKISLRGARQLRDRLNDELKRRSYTKKLRDEVRRDRNAITKIIREWGR